MRGVPEFMEEWALLGELWMEDYFDVGNPLINSGGSKLTFSRCGKYRSRNQVF
jgi:hypothetical protein